MTDERTISPRLGVILAGGRARRMGGGDKGLITLGGETLLARIARRLAAQLAGGRAALRLNANGDPARFDALGLPVIADSASDFAGPLAGVLAGLDAARASGAAEIVTVAGDTPYFPGDLVERLDAARQETGAAIILAATRDEEGGLWRHPTFGLWPARLAEDLRTALVDEGVRKVVAWAERHGVGVAEFPVVGPADPFFNVNTPADRDEAERLLPMFDGAEEGS